MPSMVLYLPGRVHHSLAGGLLQIVRKVLIPFRQAGDEGRDGRSNAGRGVFPRAIFSERV